MYETGKTPAQAAAHAFVTGCIARGLTASQASVPPEGQLATVRGLWADVAQAALDARITAMLNVPDGGTVVIAFRDPVTEKEAEELQDRWAEFGPESVSVVIVDGAAAVAAAAQPSPDQDALALRLATVRAILADESVPAEEARRRAASAAFTTGSRHLPPERVRERGLLEWAAELIRSGQPSAAVPSEGWAEGAESWLASYTAHVAGELQPPPALNSRPTADVATAGDLL